MKAIRIFLYKTIVVQIFLSVFGCTAPPKFQTHNINKKLYGQTSQMIESTLGKPKEITTERGKKVWIYWESIADPMDDLKVLAGIWAGSKKKSERQASAAIKIGDVFIKQPNQKRILKLIFRNNSVAAYQLIEPNKVRSYP